MSFPTFDWQWLRFNALSLADLYDALALRSRVFVVEQRSIYHDADGIDMQSWHLLGRNAQGQLQAYLRLVDPGARFDEPSIGRVVTAPECRGQGLGRELMLRGLAQCAQVWPGQAVRISAQSHLRGFYGDLGFVAQGDDYSEDDIPHVQMLRAPSG